MTHEAPGFLTWRNSPGMRRWAVLKLPGEHIQPVWLNSLTTLTRPMIYPIFYTDENQYYKGKGKKEGINVADHSVFPAMELNRKHNKCACIFEKGW